jgi:hypothetical protein
MNNPVTIVTSFFDINRAEKGDGRTIDDYKSWIKETLKLNCNLFIITEEKFKDFFIENRNPSYNTMISIIDFKDLYFYKYYEQMKTIIESDEYKQKIAYPNRVECVLPEYNIIQYSKLHCLKIAIEKYPFGSETFFWLDAGASRFFSNMDISQPFPSNNGLSLIKQSQDKFICQCRPDMDIYPMDSNFIWKADNLIYGGMFGGTPKVIDFIFFHLDKVFSEVMLSSGNVNNEQLALAIICKAIPQAFAICKTYMNEPIYLLRLLSS